MGKKTKNKKYAAALYLRLSRDDGDTPESESIASQRTLLQYFCATHPDLTVVEEYVDDGFTGTNFNRPAFQRMMGDIESGAVNCVIVKDLSRFGRDYVDAGRYLERIFPTLGVRFIAVTDHVDSINGPYDMLLPIRNLFNDQYARDISKKVKSSMKARQKSGKFIGAFASYGYQKDPGNHNHLIIDPPAAAVVQRIFDLYEQGCGKIRIATMLNEEGLSCPSEYKKLAGLKYHNANRLEKTNYWTYATIHRMLTNKMYIGTMSQAHHIRHTMHGKAQLQDEEDWIEVENAHDPIITLPQWERVQKLLTARGRENDYEQNLSPFAGFLKCADCGRAMVKKRYASGIYYKCGSFIRYGKTTCTPHVIRHDDLEAVVLADLNHIIGSVQDLKALAEEHRPQHQRNQAAQTENLERSLKRIKNLKKSSYEDYKEGNLSKEDYLAFREDYDRQEEAINKQLNLLQNHEEKPLEQPWVDNLLRLGRLTELDRVTVAETIEQIRIFEGRKVEITYRFSDELGSLLDKTEAANKI